MEQAQQLDIYAILILILNFFKYEVHYSNRNVFQIEILFTALQFYGSSNPCSFCMSNYKLH